MRGQGFWYGLAVVVLKPLNLLLVRRDWRHRERLPRDGGVLLVMNHISYVDPVVVGHFVHDNGRPPRFLAKASLWNVPVVRGVLRGTGQIPVRRGSVEAGDALTAAFDALRDGGCVIVYPEGTTTKDPDLWPMRARTGVARLALDAGVPVVPVGQWGAQRIYREGHRTQVWRRPVMTFVVGDPVDLSAWAGRPHTAAVLREVTDHIMDAVVRLVAEARGERPPAEARGEQPPAESPGGVT